ncbi:hypothetical protein QE364_002622 [Nocardioides zeae]|uniref:Uncharacterized protein n=1 Tax=Nocardioides zeae TaxID=1457234 RepID=A0ACC6IJI5_9ACTN|nr:hypothetical protein [Nocardioides zeae]MDR6173497.1 hypothetical protein [Nocardioides zeae]MDR6210903.1 hypothetical protein [Nocardioides zeae]
MAGGKRAGDRSGEPNRARGSGRALALHALGITLTVVAWGYLVWMAIDLGRAARDDGSGVAWLLLALACLGAIACLFVGLLLGGSALRLLGGAGGAPGDQPPRPTGGKRAAR